MGESRITITYLSRLTGVRSKTIAGYVRLLRPVAFQIYEDPNRSAK